MRLFCCFSFPGTLCAFAAQLLTTQKDCDALGPVTGGVSAVVHKSWAGPGVGPGRADAPSTHTGNFPPFRETVKNYREETLCKKNHERILFIIYVYANLMNRMTE
jgi:hypothetical protein